MVLESTDRSESKGGAEKNKGDSAADIAKELGWSDQSRAGYGWRPVGPRPWQCVRPTYG